MPRGDGTGPMGFGPMTGRGAGYCAGFPVPGYANRWAPYGFGFGRGRGFRRMYYLTGMPGWARYGYAGYPVQGQYNTGNPSQVEFLKNQEQFLEEQLKQVKEQLKAIKQDENESDE